MDIDAAAAEAYTKPFPNPVDIEFLIAKRIVKRGIVVVPMIVVAAWMIGGGLAAKSAAIGAVVILINFLFSGWLLSRAATISMQIYHVAALLGFFLRLGFITVSMFAVANVLDVDRRALGIAAVATFMVLLILESLATLRGAGKELEWS